MNKRMSRRKLLAQAGASAGAAWFLAGQTAWAATRPAGANNRVGLALIGCGQRGWQLLDLLLRRDDVNLPVVCDVDSKAAGLAAERVEQAGWPKPETAGDFLKVLERPNVDAVIIATPDHWHVIQHLYACAAKKDVYIEAPVSHDLIEGAAMAQVTRKYHRVVQVGMQHRSAPWFAEAVEQVRDGKLGKVAETRSWQFARVKPIAPQDDAQPPATLDYDRWVGPAPMRPYNPARSQGQFYNWWDYGGGMATRWNVQNQDLVHWAMRTNAPACITAGGGNQGLGDFRETPDTLEVIFEYKTQLLPRPGKFIHIYSMRLSNGHAVWAPPVPAHDDSFDAVATMHNGTLFFGQESTLLVEPRGLATFPTSLRQDKPIDTPVKDRTSPLFDVVTMAHLEDFINCVRTRGEPKAPIEAGNYAAAACHLANIAYRTGHKIYYNPSVQMCFSDAEFKIPDTAANEMIRSVTYRDPYGPPRV